MSKLSLFALFLGIASVISDDHIIRYPQLFFCTEEKEVEELLTGWKENTPEGDRLVLEEIRFESQKLRYVNHWNWQ